MARPIVLARPKDWLDFSLGLCIIGGAMATPSTGDNSENATPVFNPEALDTIACAIVDVYKDATRKVKELEEELRQAEAEVKDIKLSIYDGDLDLPVSYFENSSWFKALNKKSYDYLADKAREELEGYFDYLMDCKYGEGYDSDE